MWEVVSADDHRLNAALDCYFHVGEQFRSNIARNASGDKRDDDLRFRLALLKTVANQADERVNFLRVHN